jgi:16S rRNA (guanine1207-N2)-methyltransferase
MTDGVSVLEVLERAPDVDAPELVAVDAADRLLLDTAAPLIAAAPDAVAVVDDAFGALTLGAIALHGASGVRVHQDSVVGEAALARNAERTGLRDDWRSLPLGPDLVRGARVVLVRAPRGLDALREMAEVVAGAADPGVTVLVGGRDKHMTRGMNDVLRDSFAEVSAGLGRQKSRVLTARGPRPGVVRSFPRCEQHADLGLTVCAHGAAFAGARIDVGTRALLAVLDEMAPDATDAVDLGCGSGVLAAALLQRRPGLHVTAADSSAAAVASAAATAAANGWGDRMTVVRDDAGASLAPGSADLVVCNPPFHSAAAVVPQLAARLFRGAARLLRPGGELWTVYNTPLDHRAALSRLVGPTRFALRTPKFTVAVSVRR